VLLWSSKESILTNLLSLDGAIFKIAIDVFTFLTFFNLEIDFFFYLKIYA